MGQGGLEPPTPRLSSVCSNQLSYWPKNQSLGCVRHSGTPRLRKPRRPQAPHREGCAASARSSQNRNRPAAMLVLPRAARSKPTRERPRLPPQNKFKANQCCRSVHSQEPRSLPHAASLKGGDPAAGSPTATLLRLHPSHRPHRGKRPPYG